MKFLAKFGAFGRFRPLVGGAAVALSVGAGLTLAQPAEERVGEPELSAEASTDARLTGPEQIARGEEIVAYATQLSQRARQMLDEAQQSADLIRATCVDDKLDQINAMMRSAESRLESLRDAVAASDDGRRNHEFTVLTVMAQNLRVLDTEAAQCVGQDIFDTGATRVETIIEDGSPEEDITEIPDAPDLPIPYIPPPASNTI